MFSWRNKKDISIFWMKKVPYLLLWLRNQEQFDQSTVTAQASLSKEFGKYANFGQDQKLLSRDKNVGSFFLLLQCNALSHIFL